MGVKYGYFGDDFGKNPLKYGIWDRQMGEQPGACCRILDPRRRQVRTSSIGQRNAADEPDVDQASASSLAAFQDALERVASSHRDQSRGVESKPEGP